MMTNICLNLQLFALEYGFGANPMTDHQSMWQYEACKAKLDCVHTLRRTSSSSWMHQLVPPTTLAGRADRLPWSSGELRTANTSTLTAVSPHLCAAHGRHHHVGVDGLHHRSDIRRRNDTKNKPRRRAGRFVRTQQRAAPVTREGHAHPPPPHPRFSPGSQLRGWTGLPTSRIETAAAESCGHARTTGHAHAATQPIRGGGGGGGLSKDRRGVKRCVFYSPRNLLLIFIFSPIKDPLVPSVTSRSPFLQQRAGPQRRTRPEQGGETGRKEERRDDGQRTQVRLGNK